MTCLIVQKHIHSGHYMFISYHGDVIHVQGQHSDCTYNGVVYLCIPVEVCTS